MKNQKWRSYLLEFLSIFVAVIAAFALNNWNENRRDTRAETKILAEISNGLEKDIGDIRINQAGHEEGMRACDFWRKLINGQPEKLDSLQQFYLSLTRDFVSIQNTAGYETLKSRGLELVKNDSLRLDIISLYEYDYNTLLKLEESYQETQFQRSFYHEFNDRVAPNFRFGDAGEITGITVPLVISESDRRLLLSYLWKIQLNRRFILYSYADVKQKVTTLRGQIERELAR